MRSHKKALFASSRFMCDMNIAKACGVRETSSKYIYASLLLSRYFGSWLKLYGDFCNVTVSTDRSATENTQSVGAGALRVTCASL